MLQTQNQTPFQATIGVFNNPQGIESAYGFVKATFSIHGGQLVPAQKQLPFAPVDVHFDDAPENSLAIAGELSLCKPKTDVVLMGHAYATGGPMKESLVTLKAGEMEKSVSVFGDRVWKEGVLGAKMSDPVPFEKMPLVFERAFGGTDPEPRDENNVDYVTRNPVGRGLVPNNSKLKPEGIPLPNLEDPQKLIRSTGDRPDPACFAPIAPHWQPRQSFAGTYDEAWQKNRAPYLPEDFDSQFFNVASEDLQAESFFEGGETVEITGATPSGFLGFTIPVCTMEHHYDMGGSPIVYQADLDTVVIEPDFNRVTMLWRSTHAVDKELLRLKTFGAHCPQFTLPKAA